jgi:hypothetical protein
MIYDLRSNGPRPEDYIAKFLEWRQRKEAQDKEFQMMEQQRRAQLLNAVANMDDRTRAQYLANPENRSMLGFQGEYQADPRVAVGDDLVNQLRDRQRQGVMGQAPPSMMRVPNAGAPQPQPQMGQPGGNILQALFEASMQKEGMAPQQQTPPITPMQPRQPGVFDASGNAPDAAALYSLVAGHNPSEGWMDDMINRTEYSPNEYRHVQDVNTGRAVTADQGADNTRDENHFQIEWPLKEGEYKSRIRENDASAYQSTTGARQNIVQTESERLKQQGKYPAQPSSGGPAAPKMSAIDEKNYAHYSGQIAKAQAGIEERKKLLTSKNRGDLDVEGLERQMAALQNEINLNARQLKAIMDRYGMQQQSAPAADPLGLF